MLEVVEEPHWLLQTQQVHNNFVMSFIRQSRGTAKSHVFLTCPLYASDSFSVNSMEKKKSKI
jgi:hypothetical protein